MKKIFLVLLAIIPLLAFKQHIHKQKTDIFFSQDWNTMFIPIVLVPEEDSPFHYGVWGINRGSHLFEVNMRSKERKLIHSPLCKCR